MGLDMYLYYHENNDDTKTDREIMYWRKANAIHKWFVFNVQSGEDKCEPHALTTDDLHRLLHACRIVVAKRNTDVAHEYANYFLPTGSGFFFGSTEYDDWYYEGLMRTIEEVGGFLRDFPGNETEITMYYRSCW